MAERSDFYVYEHWRPDKGECFYVGKGHGDRAHRMERRSKHHKNIVSKLEAMGMCVEVVLFASGLTEQEAFEIEKSRIAHYRDMGVRLANKTDGGDGITGYRHTEEMKEHFSNIRKGHPPTRGTTGMKLSEETRQKMSARKKGKKPNNFGKKVNRKPATDEARRNMSIAAKKRFENPEAKKHLKEIGEKGRASRQGALQ